MSAKRAAGAYASSNGWTETAVGKGHAPPMTGEYFLAKLGPVMQTILRYDREAGAFYNRHNQSVPLSKILMWKHIANPTPMRTEPKVWRSSASLRGVRSALVAAINSSEDGAYAMLDLKSARNLVEVCDQAIHMEEGHGL